METKKTNEGKHIGCVLAIVALGVLLLGLIGYIVCEKTIWKKECEKCEVAKVETEDELVADTNGGNAAEICSTCDGACAGLCDMSDFEWELWLAYERANIIPNAGGSTNRLYALEEDIVTNARFAPYQTVEASRGIPLNFYRFGEDGEWQFVFANSGVVECTFFTLLHNAQFAFSERECIYNDASGGEALTEIGDFFSLY